MVNDLLKMTVKYLVTTTAASLTNFVEILPCLAALKILMPNNSVTLSQRRKSSITPFALHYQKIYYH